MYLHTDTVSSLHNNKHKFSEDIQQSIKTLEGLIMKNSPLSDINLILQRSNTKLQGIQTPNGSGSWTPIRNLLRIIAKIGNEDPDGTITRINVESMVCGCDYFTGDIKIELNESRDIGGSYKWQWTAFPGNNRSYNKFIEFPKLHPEDYVI